MVTRGFRAMARRMLREPRNKKAAKTSAKHAAASLRGFDLQSIQSRFPLRGSSTSRRTGAAQSQEQAVHISGIQMPGSEPLLHRNERRPSESAAKIIPASPRMLSKLEGQASPMSRRLHSYSAATHLPD
jgi:hypothetical protein